MTFARPQKGRRRITMGKNCDGRNVEYPTLPNLPKYEAYKFVSKICYSKDVLIFKENMAY